VHELVGWHIELYIDSRELSHLKATILRLPAVSIDHLGLSKEGFAVLLFLAEKGVRVKASGFGRVDFDVVAALQQLVLANPDALMFGTDLPSTRALRPFVDEDIAQILNTFDEKLASKILYSNAIKWYTVK
jgi:predicted TIM-barrel fold metal-dependent hydrolase